MHALYNYQTAEPRWDHMPQVVLLFGNVNYESQSVQYHQMNVQNIRSLDCSSVQITGEKTSIDISQHNFCYIGQMLHAAISCQPIDNHSLVYSPIRPASEYH